ncbi:phosphate acetyltransferase [Buchnera aphidicola]|uniref:phosphate acetyltransferase n=1 Tax=Buchnera aphidicola TaxID=9 RepID=UPI0031B8AC35
MFSSIILFPVGKKVDLISALLNLINFINKNNIEIIFFKLISKKNINDDLNFYKNFCKNKISNFIKPTCLKNTFNLEDKKVYNFVLEKSIEKYFSAKCSKKIILIEGINTKYNNYIERKFNLDFAKSVNSKILFITNYNKFFIFNLKIIKNIFLKDFLYLKNFILGLIIHKKNQINIKNCFNIEFYICNKNKKYFLFCKKLLSIHKLRKCLNLIDVFVWRLRIKYICTSKIFNILNVKYLYNKITFKKKIKFFIFGKIKIVNNKNFYKNYIFVIDTNNKKELKNFLYILNKKFLIGAILLIIKNNYIRKFVNIFLQAYKNNIPVFFSNETMCFIKKKLKKFYFNNVGKSYTKNYFLNNYIFLLKNKFLIKNTFSIIKKYFLTSHYFKYYLKKTAKNLDNVIIFPEGYETRILKAVSFCAKKKIAKCILLGNEYKINKLLNFNKISLNKNNVTIIDPKNIRKNYIKLFIKSRLPKILDEYSAKKFLKDNCVLATLMLKNNEADCLVSGSVNTTANTIRPALQIIKTKKFSTLVSSFFFMLLENKVLIYADCAINIDPDEKQLAEIAIETANSAIKFGIFPKVAMISYSTKNSGFGHSVDKVKNATLIVKKKCPNLLIDGPVQYDVASSLKIAKLKNYVSNIAGKANIFIFPDLNTGNSIYKAVQHSTNTISIGPILQGINKPVNDLSRGSTVEDIIYTIATTSIQCIKN